MSASLYVLQLLTPLAVAASGPAAAPADLGALKTALDDVVTRTNLSKARSSILVESLDDGRVVYAHDPDELLNPASNVKLFTAAAALVRLGPDYQWTTDFLLRDPIQPTGEIKDLYVRGDGDPLLTTERLYGMVSELTHQGIKSITGNIYVDDTYFDSTRVGPGFDQETSDKGYMAPTGAISLNGNTIEINVYPGQNVGDPARVELDPPSDYFALDNKATTIRSSQRGRITIKTSLDGEKQKIEVMGRVPQEAPGEQLWRKVDRPDLYFGQTLKQLLRDRGIRLKGRVKPGSTPSDAKIVYSTESDPLDVAVRKMDKVSSNFIAEQLVKCLGAEEKGVPGSWPKGVDAIEDFLEEMGLPRGSYVMKNGSGLNDTNRFSAAQVVQLVRAMAHRFGASPEYLSSLGIAGKDGTVRSRMEGTEAAGRIRAKTGTLESVTALSGIAENEAGQRFVFAVLVNDYPGKHAQINGAIDDLGVALAASGGALDVRQVGKQLLVQGTPAPSPLDELKARVITYSSLGRLANKHNLPFLRTALRTERDPALKAVVAEALFQSDRTDASGARAILDTWSTAPEVWGRLKAVGQALGAGQPPPVVGSLLDIAAEGNGEALARTVELAALAQGDPVLTSELADGFDQISRNAPDELLAALKAAPADAGQAALALVAQGNVASTEGESPFAKAIAKAESGKDPDLATYAKTLETDYAARLADAKAKPAVATAAVATKAVAVAPAAAAPTPAPAAPPNVSGKAPGG